MKELPAFSIISLGCPKNTVDSEILRGELEKAGWQFKSQPEKVDYLLINTCGFIQPAKEESIETILQTIASKKSGKIGRIIVMGCLTQRYFQEIKQEIPEIDQLFGVDAQAEILNYLLGSNLTCPDFTHSRRLLTPSHTAYLKIAEGCDNTCSFCAIPAIRGKQKSQSLTNLLAEAEYLASLGVKELVIIAQDTTRYGSDLRPPATLYDLLETLLKARLFPWVRLMYANPAFWHPRLNRLFSQYQELCPYLDIPIQHASDRLLRMMRRGITRSNMRQIFRKLRQDVPEIALRSAVIVGYPSESRQDFDELLQFLEEMRFARLGVFTYSAEEGTLAAEMPDDVAPEEKAERQEIIEQLQFSIAHEFAVGLVGKELPVLVEKKVGREYWGRSRYDAPEVDCSVIIESKKNLSIGQIYTVKIRSVEDLDLRASYLD
jgi:ribosomal protein S12 methylthiotransferase